MFLHDHARVWTKFLPTWRTREDVKCWSEGLENIRTTKGRETPSLEDRYVPLRDLLTREPKRTSEFGVYFFFSVFFGSLCPLFFGTIFWRAWVVGKIARSAGWERARASRAGVKVSGGGGGGASASTPGARRGHARVSLLLFLLILSQMTARARACQRALCVGSFNATCPLCNGMHHHRAHSIRT